MKNIALTIAILISCSASAFNFGEAQNTAMEFLNTGSIMMDNESPHSYFFLDVQPSDIEDEFPCIRGVVIDKHTATVKNPLLDKEVNIFLSYSDTYIGRDGLTVYNCAD